MSTLLHMPKPRPIPLHRVMVTQRFFDDASRDYLQANGCEVILAELPEGQADGNLTEAALVQLLDGAAGWIVGHAQVSDRLLSKLPALQVIARRGVGYERVDLAAVERHGKVATIAAGGNDASVADHTLALMLAVAHRLRECQDGMLAGSWAIPMGSDLYRKAVGIIGLGRIGRGVVQRLKGFETPLLACGPESDRAYAEAQGIRWVDLPTLLREADIVSLHLPLTAQTRFMINADTLALMKPSAILVNAARSGLVEDQHLLAALTSGRLQGAGLDVFASESDPAYQPVTEQLLALPNVVASPHSGASTREGLARTNLIAAQSVVAVLRGGTPAAGCVIADGRQPTPNLVKE